MSPRRRAQQSPKVVCALLVSLIGLALVPGGSVAQTPAGPPSGLGNCILGGGPNIESACTALIESGSASPQQRATAYAWRGDLYRRQRNFDLAFADLDEAFKLDPDSWEVHMVRGLAHRDKGQLDEALADYNRAIEIDPRRPAAFVERGFLMTLRHDTAQAMKDYDHAAELNPDFWTAYLSRGSLFVQLGDAGRAMADFNHAAALNPSQWDIFFRRGNLFQRSGDLDHAIADFSRSIVLAPNQVNPYAGRADAFYAKGDFDRAVADYDHVLTMTPDNKVAQERRRLALASKAEIANAGGPGAAAPSAPAASPVAPNTPPAPGTGTNTATAPALVAQAERLLRREGWTKRWRWTTGRSRSTQNPWLHFRREAWSGLSKARHARRLRISRPSGGAGRSKCRCSC